MHSAIQLGYHWKHWKPLPKYFDQDRAQIQRTMGGPGSTRQRLEALSGQFAELSEHRQWWLLSAELWLYAQRDPDACARLATLEQGTRHYCRHFAVRGRPQRLPTFCTARRGRCRCAGPVAGFAAAALVGPVAV